MIKNTNALSVLRYRATRSAFGLSEGVHDKQSKKKYKKEKRSRKQSEKRNINEIKHEMKHKYITRTEWQILVCRVKTAI